MYFPLRHTVLQLKHQVERNAGEDDKWLPEIIFQSGTFLLCYK